MDLQRRKILRGKPALSVSKCAESASSNDLSVNPALRSTKSYHVTGQKLCRLLNITPATLRRWRGDKTLGFPPAKSVSGQLLFQWQAVSAWLEK